MADVKHIMVPVSRAEAQNGMNLGYKFAMENQDRWIELDYTFTTDFATGFDKGTTSIVLKGKVYALHKDYLDPDNNRRIYIVKELDLSSDRYIAPSEETTKDTTNSTEETTKDTTE